MLMKDLRSTALIGAAALFLTMPTLAQAPKAAATSATSAAAAKKWTAPKTPWGDPDIQGIFSNLSENGTPLEKPDQFKGRQLQDVTGQELVDIRRGIQNRTIQNFSGPLHAPDTWWQKDLNLEKGSQAWLILDPEDGKIPALTAEAVARNSARAAERRANPRGPSDSWIDRSYYDRCITRGLPGSMMPAIYGNSYEIVQTPGTVVILYEMIHEARVIPITTKGAPHISSHVASYMGDARGYWEGNTLVVETTNFKDETAYRGANGATLKLTERFTRTAPKTVTWSITVDDPKTWVRPWTFAMPLTQDETQPVLEYGCHEGNHGLRNILAAARAEEKAAAEAKK
jgi:hypothetical protein